MAKTAVNSVSGYRNAFRKELDLYDRTEDAEDRTLLALHSERVVFYALDGRQNAEAVFRTPPSEIRAFTYTTLRRDVFFTETKKTETGMETPISA